MTSLTPVNKYLRRLGFGVLPALFTIHQVFDKPIFVSQEAKIRMDILRRDKYNQKCIDCDTTLSVDWASVNLVNSCIQ